MGRGESIKTVPSPRTMKRRDTQKEMEKGVLVERTKILVVHNDAKRGIGGWGGGRSKKQGAASLDGLKCKGIQRRKTEKRRPAR